MKGTGESTLDLESCSRTSSSGGGGSSEGRVGSSACGSSFCRLSAQMGGCVSWCSAATPAAASNRNDSSSKRSRDISRCSRGSNGDATDGHVGGVAAASGSGSGMQVLASAPGSVNHSSSATALASNSSRADGSMKCVSGNVFMRGDSTASIPSAPSISESAGGCSSMSTSTFAMFPSPGTVGRSQVLPCSPTASPVVDNAPATPSQGEPPAKCPRRCASESPSSSVSSLVHVDMVPASLAPAGASSSSGLPSVVQTGAAESAAVVSSDDLTNSAEDLNLALSLVSQSPPLLFPHGDRCSTAAVIALAAAAIASGSSAGSPVEAGISGEGASRGIAAAAEGGERSGRVLFGVGQAPGEEDWECEGFLLPSDPAIVLRILAECNLGAADLAKLELTSRFFREPAGFPPDPSLGLVELAALDGCVHRCPSFRKLSCANRRELKERCGGSWKLVLRVIIARQLSARVGSSQVAAGCAHSITISSSGRLWTFGHGAVGQLGHGATTSAPEAPASSSAATSSAPTLSHTKPRMVHALQSIRLVQAAAGRSRTMVVSDGGVVYRFGRDCFGDQEYSMASPRAVHTPRVVDELSGIHVVQVAMGSFFTAVLSAEGRVYTLSWGEGERLGHATDQADTQPRLLVGNGLEDAVALQIAGGHCYLLVLTTSADGGNTVWSVGCGLGGKLGHGRRCDERTPREITHFHDIRFRPVAVAAGAWHAVALSSDGRVATWGWGRHGCLGHGTDQCETVPRVIDSLAGLRACHVAAGDYTTFVVGEAGQVWSFGSTESACLGHDRRTAAAAEEEEDEGELYEYRHRSRDVFVPRRVTALEALVGRGDRVVQISTSNAGHWDAHMLALTQRGAVLACGSGSKGQLGCELSEEMGRERGTPAVVEGLCLA